MTLPGETVGYHPEGVECPDCGLRMFMDVQQSAAGYYLGYFCENCGPYSRESGYYFNWADARSDLRRMMNGEPIVNPRPGNMW